MYVHIRVLLSTSVQIIVLWWPAACCLLPTNLHIISVLHSGNNSSSRDCPIVIPPAAAAGLGTAAGLQGNSDGKWSCLSRVPQLIYVNGNTIFGEHSYYYYARLSPCAFTAPLSGRCSKLPRAGVILPQIIPQCMWGPEYVKIESIWWRIFEF